MDDKNVVDLGKKREQKGKEEGEMTAFIYPCVCGNMTWIKTNVGDFCAICETMFDDLEFDIGDN